MGNFALFVVGLLITIPAAFVVIALVFAAGIDERAEKKRQLRSEPQTARSS